MAVHGGGRFLPQNNQNNNNVYPPPHSHRAYRMLGQRLAITYASKQPQPGCAEQVKRAHASKVFIPARHRVLAFKHGGKRQCSRGYVRRFRNGPSPLSSLIRSVALLSSAGHDVHPWHLSPDIRHLTFTDCSYKPGLSEQESTSPRRSDSPREGSGRTAVILCANSHSTDGLAS